MAAPPMIVRRERQHPDDTAGPVVNQPLAEERAVSAIVLDHEEPHQKAGGGYGNGEAEPVAPAQAGPHGDPEQDKRHGRDEELDPAAHVARCTIAVQDWQPAWCRARVAARCFDFQERTTSSWGGTLRGAPLRAPGSARERRAYSRNCGILRYRKRTGRGK